MENPETTSIAENIFLRAVKQNFGQNDIWTGFKW